VVLGAAHFMVIGPRLKDAHEKFGDAFHSFPSYWMWLDKFGGPDTIDDPSTCYGWMAAHNTPAKRAAVIPSERPSLSNYLRTHTREEFTSRLWNGTLGSKNRETGVVGRVPEFFWPQQTKLIKDHDKWSGWRGILEWRGLYLGWLSLVLLGLLGAVAVAPKAQHAGHVVCVDTREEPFRAAHPEGHDGDCENENGDRGHDLAHALNRKKPDQDHDD
jgi:hypothetical protein